MFERQRGMVTVASSGVNDRLGGNGVFPLNFSPVIFADLGDATFSSFDPLIGVGGGLSILQGFVRLNLSKGLEPDRDLRLDLLFRAPR